MINWRVWDYDRNLLGEVCADSLGAAMKLARSVWPEKLNGDHLFDLVPGDQVNDPLIKIIQKGSRK